MATSAPACAYPSATAQPIPPEEPVTEATLPFNENASKILSGMVAALVGNGPN